MFYFTVWQKDKKANKPTVIVSILSAFSAYICFFPIFLLDVFVWQFQLIYFTIHQIPKIIRSEYVILDRYQLGGLNIFQKFNCVYCGYANGVIAYMKAVMNQMEIYSCAIKHVRTPKGQEHHKKFHSRSKYE